MSKPAVLLLHGGMHGGWCWRRVRPLLTGEGYEVHCPTLTGLGDRSHLGGAEIDLSAHICDVMNVIEAEELEDFLLVGHSYAGMVISGVADQLPSETLDLLYLDALVPESGQSASDIVSRGADYTIFEDGMLPFIPGYDFGLTDPADIAWVRRRIGRQSVRTVTEPLDLATDLSRFRRSYVECVQQRDGQMQMEAIARVAARVAADASWHCERLEAPHDCMISHPRETADAIIAAAERRTAARGMALVAG